MKILQINESVNIGSTGRIAEYIGQSILKQGYKSYIAAAQTSASSKSETIRIGNKLDNIWHVAYTRLLDRHGFASGNATIKLVDEIRTIQPDLIHLHNIHGYYLNVRVLFEFLKEIQKPVVWTFHDCWPFTGHCAYFDRVNCKKWETMCYECPLNKLYPASLWFDQSKKNFRQKKELFVGLKNLLIVTPSQWLGANVARSFLGAYPIKVINNGIDVEVFKPGSKRAIAKKYGIKGKIILGVASVWDKRKGLDDFILLHKQLPKDYQIVLVGLSLNQIKKLPVGIIGIRRTESLEDLAAFYAQSMVFINPTYVDNFPTTNLEALACGTPVITYDTGGSPEAIDETTGIVIGKGDISGILSGIDLISRSENRFTIEQCRNRALELYRSSDRYVDYVDVYEHLLFPQFKPVE